MSFIFIGHFVWELINMQLQRIFYHPLRVGDPSLFPYHLHHLAWTFQVVYQTDAFSCKPPLLLRISCPVLLHLHILWVRTQRPSPPRSTDSEFKIRLSSSGWLLMWHSRHFHNGHSLSPSPHDRSGLRRSPCGSRHPWRCAALQGDVVNMLYSESLSRHEPRISEINPCANFRPTFTAGRRSQCSGKSDGCKLRHYSQCVAAVAGL